MSINWITFIAQFINFIVLVWLLKRFLYRPILTAVDKRQAEITKKVNQAHNEYELAKKEHLDLEQKQQDFKKQRDELFIKANEQIEELKKQQANLLVKEKEKALQKIHSDIALEKDSISEQIKELAVDKFMKLSYKLVTDFGILTPMDNAILLFLKQINLLDSKKIAEIEKALSKQSQIIVYSSEELSDKSKKEIQDTFMQKISKNTKPTFLYKENKELVLGLEIKISDLLVEWNLKSYLDTLHDDINTSLNEKLIAS